MKSQYITENAKYSDANYSSQLFVKADSNNAFCGRATEIKYTIWISWLIYVNQNLLQSIYYKAISLQF